MSFVFIDAESVEKLSFLNLDWSNYGRSRLSLVHSSLFPVFPEAVDLVYANKKMAFNVSS